MAPERRRVRNRRRGVRLDRRRGHRHPQAPVLAERVFRLRVAVAVVDHVGQFVHAFPLRRPRERAGRRIEDQAVDAVREARAAAPVVQRVGVGAAVAAARVRRRQRQLERTADRRPVVRERRRVRNRRRRVRRAGLVHREPQHRLVHRRVGRGGGRTVGAVHQVVRPRRLRRARQRPRRRVERQAVPAERRLGAPLAQRVLVGAGARRRRQRQAERLAPLRAVEPRRRRVRRQRIAAVVVVHPHVAAPVRRVHGVLRLLPQVPVAALDPGRDVAAALRRRVVAGRHREQPLGPARGNLDLQPRRVLLREQVVAH